MNMTTPEERIAVLETKVDGQGKWLESIDTKVDKLLEAANMAGGGWLVIMKLGGLLVMAAGFGAWVVDHIAPFFRAKVGG